VGTEFAPALEAGLSLVFFLEGTSTDGRAVLPFKSSLLEPAIRAQIPVVPAAVVYDVPREHSAAQEVCWWGDMTLAPHLFNLAGMPHVTARLAFGTPLTKFNDRKLLAVTLCNQVRLLHREISSVSCDERLLQSQSILLSTA
jgi:1-acyl-sn-glycerol-3-phosphate acyltransferase